MWVVKSSVRYVKRGLSLSRIAKEPIVIPDGVKVEISGGVIKADGPEGSLQMPVHQLVKVSNEDSTIVVQARNSSVNSRAMSGTMRSLINNMVVGVKKGFHREMTLVGTGYRAQANGSNVNLSLGYSHPIAYEAPEGVTFEVKSESSSQVELVIKGIDKQVVGQVAADIRRMRPPEPYKGKGVRYSDERIRRKQAKSISG